MMALSSKVKGIEQFLLHTFVIRLEPMSDVTDEVEMAIGRLALGERVQRLPVEDAARITAELLASFVVGGDRRWWWEAFREPIASKAFSDDMGFKYIVDLVPNRAEKCWFVVEDADSDSYPVYDATPEEVASIVGECFAFEYYIAPKSKHWLICENHHGRIIGVGEEVTRAINVATV